MFPEIRSLTAMLSSLKARLVALRADKEAGYTAEAVIVIALMAACAIAVVAIIVNKVTAKANSVQTG
jgi:hypothetical protein